MSEFQQLIVICLIVIVVSAMIVSRFIRSKSAVTTDGARRSTSERYDDLAPFGDREILSMLKVFHHETKGPLLNLERVLESLLQGGLDSERSQWLLQHALRDLRRVAAAAEFVLTLDILAPVDEDAFRRELRGGRLSRLVRQMVVDLSEYARDANKITLYTDDRVLDALPEVLLNRTAAFLPVYAVLDNAIKYAFEGTTVLVSGEWDEGFAGVIVRSKGLPISRDELDRIFDRGYRTPRAEAFVPAGEGHGLYFAKRAMDLHGGSITVESAEDSTTIARVRFRRIRR